MTISKRAWTYLALSIVAATAALPAALRMTANPSRDMRAATATAEEGVVDLRAQWSRTTGDTPLDARFVRDYLLRVDDTTQRDAGADDPFGIEAGAVVTKIDNQEADSEALLSMPIIRVSPDDARQLARREAALSLYLYKYAAWRELLAQNASSVRAPEADHVQFALQATSAHSEAFLLAAIDLEAGETQALKCQASDRAALHARALGLGRTLVPVTADDVVEAWRPLLALARSVFDERYSRFDARFCTVARPTTRAESRRSLDAKLATRLNHQVEKYFDAQLELQEDVRKAISARFQDHRIEVPRTELDELTARVKNAHSTYDMVQTDAMGLEGAVTDLEKNAHQLKDPNPQTVFKGAFDKLLESHASITRFLQLAKTLAQIPSLNDAERSELAVCAALPDAFEAPVNASRTLAGDVGACLSHAVALRERLLAAGGASTPEHDRFMREVTSLSKIYLTVNRL